MGNISDKLNKLIQTKTDIKNAIISKGIPVNDNDSFSSYASKILQIQGQMPSVNINSVEDLKSGWKYKLVNSVSNSSYNSTSEATKSFDDSSWTNITIPHDWSIYNEFNSSSASGYEGGFLDGGDSWYRRKLTSLTDNSKKVFIYFDGVYKDCDVYINGTKIGSNKWYNPFYFDITSNLNFDGNDVLAVFVRNQQPSSRWYSGSGIIRNAYLVLGNSTFIGIDNAVITSNNLETNLTEGIVNTTIKTVINNTSSATVQGKIKYYIKSKGNIINTLEKDINLSIGENIIESVIKVPNPTLWDEHKGNLYSCLVEIYINDEITFKNEYVYGYRYFSFDKDKGFFLNGKHIKLKGVCMHHDLGCLGAEVNKSAIQRQIRLLKGMGCNAIRITHNPSSTEFLEVCAEEGIMLIEEAFDCWDTAKKTYDFAKDFSNYAESSLKSMIKRSVNNPAVIMWSIGNEIPGGTPKTCQQLVNWVKEIDKTRPVTMGDNQKSRTSFMDLLDVVGLNYAKDNEYSTLRSNKPNYKLYGSETASGLMSRGEYTNNNSTQQYTSFDNNCVAWGSNHAIALKRHMDNDYLAGCFVWTGFDYIGEPTSFNKYPSRSSYFGIIDLAGFPKDIYYMYQSRWTKEPMIHIMPHWNQTSSNVYVWLYSNCYKVELFVNGISKGSKLQTEIGNKYEFEYNIPYESGIIVANGYNEKGQLIAQDYIYTAGSEHKLVLKADKSVVNKNNDDFVFIECNVVDNNGILCPEASNEVTFTVENGTVIGTDNGDATDVSSSLRSNSRKAFNGKCLCVVKPNRISNTLTINATSTGLINGSITITQDNYSVIKGKENKDFIDATNPPRLDGAEIALQSISFKENDLSLSLNSPYTLKYTLNPTNTTQKDLTWSVSPSNIATINNGVITGTTEGSCVVTVTSTINSSISATCNITFANATVSVTRVSIDKTEATVKVGESIDLNATLIPSNATNQDVTWSANNSNVTLTPNSTTVTVMGANEGSSIVTVTTADGNHTATSIITVQAQSSGGGDITLPENYTELKSNFDPAGSPFKESVEFNPTTQTFYADINIDNSTLKQNILSIGNDIAQWSVDGLNIHTYNITATQLEVNMIIGRLGSPAKYNVTIPSNGRVKIAWSGDRFYVNGSSVGQTYNSLTPDNLAKLNATCQYGVAQGKVMSISHYNTIGIINSTKTDEELAQLTTI